MQGLVSFFRFCLAVATAFLRFLALPFRRSHIADPWSRWLVRFLKVGQLVVYAALIHVFLQPFGYPLPPAVTETKRGLEPSDAMPRVLLEQWSDPSYRDVWYYTPEGSAQSTTYGTRYDWFLALEQPFSTEKFIDPAHMSSFGFIVDAPSDMNPEGLPVGFTRYVDPLRAAEDPLDAEMLDITCAACHTGELHFQGRRIRIDGGPAMHAVTDKRMGAFPMRLGTALLETRFNPRKFERFASAVIDDRQPHLSGDARDEAREVLRNRLSDTVCGAFTGSGFEMARNIYPNQEGYGRLDAVGRIGNLMFGFNVDQKNYRQQRAPVSYPWLWNIWKYDHVQYQGYARQALARNVSQDLGSGARINFWEPLAAGHVGPKIRADYSGSIAFNAEEHDSHGSGMSTMLGLLDGLCDNPPYGTPRKRLPLDVEAIGTPGHADPGAFLATSVKLDNLEHLEELLRDLTPPAWPEAVFGPVDFRRAARGKALYTEFCTECHWTSGHHTPGVREANSAGVSPVPANEVADYPVWKIVKKHVEVVGTDPEAALAIANGRFDLTPLLEAPELRAFCDRYGGTLAGEPCSRLAKFSEDKMGLVNPVEGLNVLSTLLAVNLTAGMNPQETRRVFGLGEKDLPEFADLERYRAPPLYGIWATSPYMHNGSVRTLYHQLSPAYEREGEFWVGSREFDPVHVGFSGDEVPGAILQKSAVRGNGNYGHEFRDGCGGDGHIGPFLTREERLDVIEFLKVFAEDEDPRLTAATAHREYAAWRQANVEGRQKAWFEQTAGACTPRSYFYPVQHPAGDPGEVY